MQKSVEQQEAESDRKMENELRTTPNQVWEEKLSAKTKQQQLNQQRQDKQQEVCRTICDKLCR